jgi:hypothetical protein
LFSCISLEREKEAAAQEEKPKGEQPAFWIRIEYTTVLYISTHLEEGNPSICMYFSMVFVE